jgi:predicted Zn-dependent peptidase
MLLPAGIVFEPGDQQGAAALAAEMILRGAGDRDAKAHSDALDQLGVQRASDPETHHLRIGATMIGTRLAEALPLLADMVRRPTLADAALEPSRDLALQAIESLDDEPQQKVFVQLKARHYADPFGRSTLGVHENLEQMSLAQVRGFFEKTFVPTGAILGFAGRFDWPALRDQVEQLFGDWRGAVAEPVDDDIGRRGSEHQTAETTQVHIGLMYDAAPEPDDSSIYWRAAAAVLSGGMSSRLFTEVREKRGLCYSVYAGYAGGRDRGSMLGYAGTTVPRAQETLDVLRHELRRLSEGIDDGEFERAIVGMKSRLVMQGESTSARARAIATDQYVFGRPRTLDERSAKVDTVTVNALRKFVADHPPGDMTIVTVGPESLNV